MKMSKVFLTKVAAMAASCLTAVLFVSANSASSGVLHQAKAPKELDRFSKIK
ncbi:MAG: cyclic lactone autoinducer peptide [Massiliimalia sp.]|jgi:cyclic lactone autoinducer peptide